MVAVPFALRRPWLILRDLMVNRDRPDLARLRALREPERFVWAILPHAARTFSACIALLPARTAKAAAVGYLYCRILDTYEDLETDLERRISSLRAFAHRFPCQQSERLPAAGAAVTGLSGPAAGLPAAPLLPTAAPVDARDEGHLLLVERCESIDRVFLTLPAPAQRAIRKLVRDMAAGMIAASRLSARQGLILHDRKQLARYCHAVLGNPVAFSMRLMKQSDLDAAEVRTAMEVGEFVQLANVTRDVEKDLRRGVAYHPQLAPYLGIDARDHRAAQTAAKQARAQMFDHAMERASAYRHLFHALSFRRWSFSRASAILMLKFTDRYYRSCARRLGRPPWKGPRSTMRLLLGTFPSFFSQSAAQRALERMVTAMEAKRSC